MTGDKDNMEDAEFEAFLKGEGALAQRLREHPQPQPSPELDAAIFAEVEKDLERPKPAPKAANDPLGPRFTTRWGLPLAAAACAVFAFYMVVRHNATEERTQTIVADAGPAIAAAPQAAAPMQEEIKQTSKAVDSHKEADEARSGRSMESRAKAPSEQAIADAEAARKPTVPSTPAAALAQGPVETSEDAFSAGAPEAKPTEIIADAGKQLEPMRDDRAPQNRAAGSIGEAPVFGAAAPSDNLANRESLVLDESKPSVAAAYAPREAPAAAAASRAPAPAEAAAVPKRSALDRSVALKRERVTSDPKAWLDRIDTLLRAGASELALSEWEEFRKIYPEHEVPKTFEERIEALKK